MVILHIYRDCHERAKDQRNNTNMLLIHLLNREGRDKCYLDRVVDSRVSLRSVGDSVEASGRSRLLGSTAVHVPVSGDQGYFAALMWAEHPSIALGKHGPAASPALNSPSDFGLKSLIDQFGVF